MIERISKKPVANTLESLRSKLSIDKDDLDNALVEQPDLYYHVADAYVTAVADRDAAKLDLEQATADLDKQFRGAAAAAEEKLTETSLQRKIATTPRIQNMEKDLLYLRADADRWQALKEAFQQRSFMLRELVAMYVRRLGDLTIERGSNDARGSLAQANHDEAARIRASRKLARSDG
jgi:hypothetical protein